ncbi:MAG: hypothetical protein ACQEXI_04400 [Pseudomonadota bacterium]
MPPAAPAPLLATLRQATRQDHRALDHHPRLARLVRPGLDLAGYTDSLLALASAQAALEARVAAELAQLGHDYPLAPRMPALARDLARLDAAPPPPLGLAPEAEPASAALLGRLYVLEGSRLGARPIAARVRASLGEAAPLAYFGDAAGEQRWSGFLTFAARLYRDGAAADRAGSAAREAFALFQAALAPATETA